MKIGSLCTGYGGLDMAVEAYFNAETIWCAEYDKYASKLIEERLSIPNYKDIKSIDWNELEPIDILTAGYPCQPFSVAGSRKGSDDERHLWPYIKQAISILRPNYVILENVRGHLSLGFKEVLADLTQIGYDARWQVVRASDVGAPHQRARLFVVAYPDGTGSQRQSRQRHNVAQCSTINASTQHESHYGQMQKLRQRFTPRSQMHMQAVPDTLDNGRVSSKFVEYMMGLPNGWVTDLDISWTQQLKMLGNGVVPQQAYHALKTICDPIHIPHSEIIGDATHE
jgi:DNA (cytosine-5)-methyltransferase 1